MLVSVVLIGWVNPGCLGDVVRMNCYMLLTNFTPGRALSGTLNDTSFSVPPPPPPPPFRYARCFWVWSFRLIPSTELSLFQGGFVVASRFMRLGWECRDLQRHTRIPLVFFFSFRNGLG